MKPYLMRSKWTLHDRRAIDQMIVNRAWPWLGGPKLTTVIVGAGLVGRFHADAAHRAGSRIAAVVDCNAAAAYSLARQFSGSVAGTSLVDLMARMAPDIVHVCTPQETHYPLALEIAAAGAHALIEKPMMQSITETDEVLARFREAATFVIPAHQYAFQPVIQKTVSRIGEIGPLRRIQFDIRSSGAGFDVDRRDAIAANILPHPMSLIQRFMPDTDIGLTQWTLARAAAGEWLVTAAVDGVIVAISISMNGRPTRFSTSLLGDCGAIEIDNFNGFAVAAPASASRFHKISSPFRDAALQFSRAGTNLIGRVARREFGYVGLRSLVASFQAAVRSSNEGDLPITPAQIRANAAACAMIDLQAKLPTYGS